MLVINLFFAYFLDIRLNLYEYADVVNALHELEQRKPKVLNISFEDDKLGKDVIIDENMPHEVDKKKSTNLRNILKRAQKIQICKNTR